MDRSSACRRRFRLMVGLMLLVLLVGTSAYGFTRRGDNGQWQDVGNGWWYIWYQDGDYEHWRDSSSLRFQYTWGDHKWWDQWNGSGTWYGLTPTEFSTDFIGDGSWRNVSDNWWYAYAANTDRGFWNDGGSSNYRFAYNYDLGRWVHYGTSWFMLTPAGKSNEFIGDGGWHDTGNGWWYAYLAGNKQGFWSRGAASNYRFAYNYNIGRWVHYGISWSVLTSGGYSNDFIGDGAWRDIGNNWWFAYGTNMDHGFWNAGGSHDFRFAYDYNVGRWVHYGAGSWSLLSSTGCSGDFIGDGEWHNVGRGFSYQYIADDDEGHFKDLDWERFSYSYGPSQWYHKGDGTDWGALSATGVSAEFVGDGDWHDLGFATAWSYSYGWSGSPFAVGLFKAGDAERLSYTYLQSQWSHKGDTTDWGDLSTTGVSAQFVGDGDWHDLGNGFTYQYSAADNEGLFKVGDAERFYYTYGGAQWFHKGNGTDWAALTTGGYSAAFIGDGKTHDLSNGVGYYYTLSGDNGWFKIGGKEQFWYAYTNSQWRHKGDTTDWGDLSATGISAEFVGAGDWHDIGYGLSYQYVAADKEGYFKVGDTERFYYSYGPSQWYHKGDATDWAALGADGVSAAFVGDGETHDLGNGFTYYYSSTDDYGYFMVGAADRFYYTYGPEQWYHKGDTTNWIALTAADYSAKFIGDGGTYNLGNGFLYQYVTGDDEGNFSDLYQQQERFSYHYGPSKWYNKGNTTDWGALSASGVSAQFVGDGAWHDLGYATPWSYCYVRSGTPLGYFKADVGLRFEYDYGQSQWLHKGSGRYFGALSATGVSAHFVGDGAVHHLGNGFRYYYSDANDYGYFKVGDAERFYYGYSPAQWFHKGDTTDWTELSVANYSAKFVGDGQWHDLGNGLYYRYLDPSDYGVFTADTNSAAGFAYSYTPGRWMHQSYTGPHKWVALTADNYSIGFIGDGQWHDLGFGNGWSYRYVEADEEGYFEKYGFERFFYDYEFACWNHRGVFTDWGGLSGSGASTAFVGDGEWHDLANGFTYQYVEADEKGYFNLGENERFLYEYVLSKWFHSGNYFYSWSDLSDKDSSASFVGDGEWHDLGTGFTYQYVADGDEGHYNDGVGDRFSFHYDTLAWYHTTSHCGWVPLGSEGGDADFIGDGSWYDLAINPDWAYRYSLSTHTGYWRPWTGNYEPRFSYTYTNGLWQHKGNYGDFNHLGSEGWWNLSFLGDGSWHWVDDDDHGYKYSYVWDNDMGYWYPYHESKWAWRYYYQSGDWYYDDSLPNVDEPEWERWSGPKVSTGGENPK